MQAASITPIGLWGNDDWINPFEPLLLLVLRDDDDDDDLFISSPHFATLSCTNIKKAIRNFK